MFLRNQNKNKMALQTGMAFDKMGENTFSERTRKLALMMGRQQS